MGNVMESMICKYRYSSEEELLCELCTVNELIEAAATFEELIEIEEMIGAQAALGFDDGDWDGLSDFLSMLKSPYALSYKKLCERWVDGVVE